MTWSVPPPSHCSCSCWPDATPPQGVLLAVYGLWYGTQRLLLDFTRGLDERPVLGLTGTQLLAVGLILASGFTLVQKARRHATRPESRVG